MPEHLERTERLIGPEAVARLRVTHALVAGLGGVGGMCAEALARAGVGRLTLIDCDVVAITNLNRQVIALRSTLGMPKAEAMRARIADIDPETAVLALEERLTPETLETRVAEIAPDIVLDCIDDVPAKAALIIACARNNVRIISCMGAGNRVDPSRLRASDIYKTSGDPLARVLRRKLREEGVESLRVVWSEEPARKPLPPSEGRASTPASISVVPPAAGLLMAAEALKMLGAFG